jgi:hypothetical protein
MLLQCVGGSGAGEVASLYAKVDDGLNKELFRLQTKKISFLAATIELEESW